MSSLINIIINFTYGLATTNFHAIKKHNDIMCYNPSLITETLDEINEIIKNEFADYLIYIDTDEFYFSDFEEALPRLTEMLKNWGYSYNVEKINYFLYIDKKKVVISNTPFNTKGIKIIPSLKKRKIEYNKKIKMIHS